MSGLPEEVGVVKQWVSSTRECKVWNALLLDVRLFCFFVFALAGFMAQDSAAVFVLLLMLPMDVSVKLKELRSGAVTHGRKLLDDGLESLNEDDLRSLASLLSVSFVRGDDIEKFVERLSQKIWLEESMRAGSAAMRQLDEADGPFDCSVCVNGVGKCPRNCGDSISCRDFRNFSEMGGQQKLCDRKLSEEEVLDAFECASGWFIPRNLTNNSACDCPECDDESDWNCTKCGACPVKCGESANCAEKFGECPPLVDPFNTFKCAQTPGFVIDGGLRGLDE
eukprot:s4174_g4.t1